MTLAEQLVKTIKRNHPIREQVSQCSTGVYYPQYKDYFAKVVDILDFYGLDVEVPIIYNENGRGFVNVENNGTVIGGLVYTWYRMPSSNWEMIGYLV